MVSLLRSLKTDIIQDSIFLASLVISDIWGDHDTFSVIVTPRSRTAGLGEITDLSAVIYSVNCVENGNSLMSFAWPIGWQMSSILICAVAT